MGTRMPLITVAIVYHVRDTCMRHEEHLCAAQRALACRRQGPLHRASGALACSIKGTCVTSLLPGLMSCGLQRIRCQLHLLSD